MLADCGWKISYAHAQGHDDAEAIRIAAQEACNHPIVILATGDEDFLTCLTCLQETGNQVVVVSSTRAQDYHCAWKLRKAASLFIEITDLNCGVR
jgi:uncharacterized LabA/DUF88 family protein